MAQTINAREDIQALWAVLDKPSEADREQLRDALQRLNFWFPVKQLGMQLLFESSEEGGGRRGLGVLPGRCRRFPDDMTVTEHENVRKLKIPHIGWNEVQPGGDHYYFVHSYYVDAGNPEDVLWSASYGDVTFAAAVKHENLYGCQFHPEKSQQAGLRFLRAFLLGSRG